MDEHDRRPWSALRVLAPALVATILPWALARAGDEPRGAKPADSAALAGVDVFLDPDGIERIEMATQEGRGLTAEQAKALRARLEKDPRDLAVRLRLMGFESEKARNDPASKHPGRAAPFGPFLELALGIIEQHPRSPLAGSTGQLILAESGEGMGTEERAWERATALWTKLTADPSTADPALLGNAGTFLVSHPWIAEDWPRGASLLEQARRLDPEERRWTAQLGRVWYATLENPAAAGKMTPDEIRTTARKAIVCFEEVLLRTPRPHAPSLLSGGQSIPEATAVLYWKAGELKKVEAHASNVLASAAADPKDWIYGNKVHGMNILLGRVALQAGDVERAKKRLIDAGRTPGSPQLGAFGPDMTLARDLLAKGEKDVVLEYFDLCGKFWRSSKGEREELATWRKDIEAGRQPNFGSHVER